MVRKIGEAEVRALAEGTLGLVIPDRFKTYKKLVESGVTSEQAEEVILSSAKGAAGRGGYSFSMTNNKIPMPDVLIPLYLQGSPLGLRAGLIWDTEEYNALKVLFIVEAAEPATSEPVDSRGAKRPEGGQAGKGSNRAFAGKGVGVTPTGGKQVGNTKRKQTRCQNEKKALHLNEYAILGDERRKCSLLSELAGMAQDERWGDEESARAMDHYKWLNNYLDRTFQKQYRDGNVRESQDVRFAAFNTGLVTDSYADIYATFRQSSPEKQKRWVLVGFCPYDRLSYMDEGKKLLEHFGGSMPPRASYFTKLSDVAYEGTKDCPVIPQHSMKHIIRDRLHRFPSAYLAHVFGTEITKAEDIRADAKSMVDENKTAEKKQDAELPHAEPIAELIARHALQVTPDGVEARIGADLKTAVYEAHKRAAVNYTVAVPTYNPDREEMTFSLPLRLPHANSSGVVDLVARVVMNGKGYTIPTVLEPHVARQNARLVCGPHDSWLEAGKSRPEVRAESLRSAKRAYEGVAKAWDEEVSATAVPQQPEGAFVLGAVTVSPVTTTQRVAHPAFLVFDGARHVIDDGATVGMYRHGYPMPDICLPFKEEYNYASHNHGRFTLDGDDWWFTSSGQNGTRVLRDEQWHSLGESPFRLMDGDELEFGNGHGLYAGIEFGRVAFELG